MKPNRPPAPVCTCDLVAHLCLTANHKLAITQRAFQRRRPRRFRKAMRQLGALTDRIRFSSGQSSCCCGTHRLDCAFTARGKPVLE
jgi:hypothetical protein